MAGYGLAEVKRNRGRGIALAFAAVMLLVWAPRTSPLQAKAPGVSHCYKGVCHRVRTIEQTRRLIGHSFTVETSYYDFPGLDRFNVGTYTSNGERFDAFDPARVASADLPDGTELLLRNPANGRVSHVRVNDFGPFRGARRLDVTRRVAEDLDFRHKGVVKLDVTVIAAPQPEDLTYRRNRPPRGTRGHLGVIFEAELPAVVAGLVAGANAHQAPETVVAAVGLVPAADERSGFISEQAPALQQVTNVDWSAAFDDLIAAGALGNSDASEPRGAVLLAAQVSTLQEQADVVLAAEPQFEAVGHTDGTVGSVVTADLAIELVKTAESDVAASESSQPLGWGVALVGGDAAAALEQLPHASMVMLATSWASFAAAWKQPGGNNLLLLGLMALLASTALVAAMVRRHAILRASSSAAHGVIWPVASARAAPEVPPDARVPAVHTAAAGLADLKAPAAGVRPRSLLDAGLVIEGTLRSSGTVEIAGRFKGRIEVDELIVLAGGSVEGEVVCRSLEVASELRGKITAQTVRVAASGVVEADITTQWIAVELGARLEGEIRHNSTA